jgi:hypothetical protein
MMKETRTKIEEVEMELADLYYMSEEAACFRYNVDAKQEAIEMLNEELMQLYMKLREKENEEYSGWVDPAFRTTADFDRLRN